MPAGTDARSEAEQFVELTPVEPLIQSVREDGQRAHGSRYFGELVHGEDSRTGEQHERQGQVTQLPVAEPPQRCHPRAPLPLLPRRRR